MDMRPPSRGFGVPATIFFLCLLSGVPAIAQDAQQPQSGRGPDRLASVGVLHLAPQDRRFIEIALKGGLADVQAAELAESQGTSPDVRRAADRMLAEQSLANNELERIATTHGLVPQKEAGDERRAAYNRLRGLSGAKFDREYLRHEINSLTRTIQLYQRAQIESSSRTVKTFTATRLPRLKQHLAMLQAAQSRGNAADSRQGSGSSLEPVDARVPDPPQ
jgi:putative membrane protein